MQSSKGTILVVDDEESVRNIVARKLRSDGYDCELASNGREAVETAARQHFDLVLTDVKMPGMSGIEVLSQMVADHPDTGVVMITAMADAHTAVEAMKLGAYDYVTKPFDLETLGLRIEKALERRKLLQENKDYRLLLSEQALRESKQQYSTLVNCLADAVITSRGVITWCNDRVEEIFGYTRDELIGQNGSFFLPEPVDPADFTRYVYTATEDGKHLAGETRAQKKDGSIIHVEFSISRIPETDPPEFITVARDITERKEAEEALREVDRLKAEFVANTSHELRTPLQGIMGSTKLMLAGKVTDPETQREFLTIIDKQSERLTELINDLLDVSRMESGRFNIEKEPTSLVDVVHDAVMELDNLAAETAIEIREDVPPQLPEVEADPKRMKQVVINLLSNAIKFSDEGGQITVSARAKDEEVLISVADQGSGIPEEAIPHLFQRFYQVDGSSTRSSGGSGLGLYISGQIVEAHGGRIRVESKLGEGSTFSFAVPRPASLPSAPQG
ncbi:MAG: ATP-binding protein [Dehalococcoidia bacterium]